MTRSEAEKVLAEREGLPPESLESMRTDDMVRAVEAGEGHQPCADCGSVIRYDDDFDEYRHIGEPDFDFPLSCWLYRENEYTDAERARDADPRI